jgi:hypothetical protein
MTSTLPDEALHAADMVDVEAGVDDGPHRLVGDLAELGRDFACG